MLDSSPVVCITGQVGSKLLGSDAFQEIDITGITMPITKHNVVVSKAEDIARTVREAFVIAQSGRPGPVLVDITKDAQQATTDFDWDAAVPKLPPKRIRPSGRGLCTSPKVLLRYFAEACAMRIRRLGSSSSGSTTPSPGRPRVLF